MSGAELRQQTPGKDWLVYTTPTMDTVQILQTHYPRHDGTPARMDVYYPPHYRGHDALPGMLIFAIRKSSMHKASYVSWAQLLATANMAVITYEVAEELADYRAVRHYVATAAPSLHIRPSRLGVLAFCGALNHLSNMLPMLPRDEQLKIAYGVFFSGIVAAPSRYAPPFPVLMVDSGCDYAVCTRSFARFRREAPRYDIAHEIIEYPEGVHRFDVAQNTDETRTIITHMVASLQRLLDKPSVVP
jgi:hypothetical protein